MASTDEVDRDDIGHARHLRMEEEMVIKTTDIYERFIKANNVHTEATCGATPPVARFVLCGEAGPLRNYTALPYDFMISFPRTDEDIRMHMLSDPQICMSDEPPFEEEAVQSIIARCRTGGTAVRILDVFTEGNILVECSQDTGFHLGPFMCSLPDERHFTRSMCSFSVTCTKCKKKAWEVDYTNEYLIAKDCTPAQHYAEVREAGIPVIAGALGCKTFFRRKPGYTIEFEFAEPLRTPKALIKTIQSSYSAAQNITMYHNRMATPDPTSRICHMASRVPLEKFAVQGTRRKRASTPDPDDGIGKDAMSQEDARVNKIARTA